MKKVFIIHGFQGSPNGGWRPWLMAEFEKREIYACALAMPDPANPIPAQWVKEISRHIEASPKDQICLVGHSLGVPAILRYLEKKNAKKIRGAVLVSGPVFKTSHEKVGRFLKKPFNFKLIKSKVSMITVIHGDNDPRVSVEQGETLAKELHAELVIVKNGGHLNGSSGWTSLPQCLEVLNKMMK